MKDIMIDLETMGVIPESAILVISAVAFEPLRRYSQDPNFTVDQLEILELRVDLESQENRFIDEKTLQWWGKQDAAVIDDMFGDHGRISLHTALEQLTRFVWNKGRIWAQGIAFDIPILENAYKQCGMSVPWNYWQIRDSRTVLDLVQVDLPPASHNSTEDCVRQIIGLQEALYGMGVEKFVR